MLGMEELRAQEIAVAPDPPPMDDSATETTTVAERNDLEQRSIEEVAIGPQAQPVDTASEKTAPANLLEFYELQQQPFDVTPDPAYLYFSPSHREALAIAQARDRTFPRIHDARRRARHGQDDSSE